MVWRMLLVASLTCAKDLSEKGARDFLSKYNEEAARRANIASNAAWDYDSNINEENLKKKIDVSTDHAAWKKEQWKKIIEYPWKTYEDENIKRQFKMASVLGASALPEEKYKKLEEIITEMSSIYSTAKVCDFKDKTKCNLSLEPELTDILQKSRDPEELKHVWVEWRNASGRQVKGLFQEYVRLSNEAALLNNMSNLGELWNFDFESDTFENDILELWNQVEPLYLQLHAYVRRKLSERYGENVVSRTGPIPAHLLGNMWAQTWTNLYDITKPFPQKKSVNVTDEMKKQGYDVKKMFTEAENFFTSLNLSGMPPKFWERSILEKPKDRELVCHASAWDFYDGEDFRIKMCSEVQLNDFLVVHHEMGHIQYFLQYKEQPFIFKEGANSGFHEAVGDVIFLSAVTKKHLKNLGLLESTHSDPEETLNDLYQRALDKIAFLPFGLLVDLYRWNIFKGITKPESYNRDWWTLREKYQGIEPPVDRSNDDFDPGAKYHVVASVPYIRYFVSFIIQFQFHRSLCEAAGEFTPANPGSTPLHQCCIYGSKPAGKILGEMLKLGSSKPWPDAMEVITGQRRMDGSALIQFFQPLYDWLKEENRRTGEKIGWDPSHRKVGGRPLHPEEKTEK